ncbi:MAG: YXWGXW repeat-containing protein [Burkholderiales bacterium]
MTRAKAVRNLLLSLSLVASVFAAPAYAQISFNINIAPPAPQYESVPIIAPGHVWAPGYWGWTGERHVWVHGRAIIQRAGYRWSPDRWDQRNSSYYRTAGHWERVKVKKEHKQKGWKHDKRAKRGDSGHDNDGKHGRSDRRGD